jgi:two-component system OmpR family sensor kinase
VAGGHRFGIRARVVASFLVLLVTAEAVSITVLHQVGANQIDAQVTNDLREVADDLEVRLRNEQDDLGRDGGETLRAVFDQFLLVRPVRDQEAFLAIVDGQPFAASADASVPLASLPASAGWATLRTTDAGELDTAAGPMRYLAVPVLAGADLLGVFVVTQLIVDQQAALRDTIALVSAITVLVLLAACLLAWGAAGRALRPLHQLAVTTRSVAGGDDLDARVEVRGDDEVADLGASVNAMLERLQRSFDSQKRFLDDAGHELRTPLTIVRGHVELLDDDPAVRAGEVALIVDEIDRMERLVADLRILARSERPDFLAVDPVDARAFVAAVTRKAEAIAPRRWTTRVEVDGTVPADRQRLTQAMLNLAENAANVTAEGDTITIAAAERDGALVLSVSDDGPGIAAEDQPTLFDRTGRAVRRRVSGTGLGLPIVAAVARAHGGRASVTSEVGVGTTVEITIPGLRPTPAPGEAHAGPTAGPTADSGGPIGSGRPPGASAPDRPASTRAPAHEVRP